MVRFALHNPVVEMRKHYKNTFKNELTTCLEKYLLLKVHAILVVLFSCYSKCCLLITFANSLDPDQDRQNVGPVLDPNSLTLK